MHKSYNDQLSLVISIVTIWLYIIIYHLIIYMKITIIVNKLSQINIVNCQITMKLPLNI